MRLFKINIAFLIGTLAFSIVVFAAAGNDLFAGITYPIAELGNCSDRNDCEAYCDEPENMGSCLSFARAHNLLSQEEIEKGERMLAFGEEEGPGGCRGIEQCEAYCDEMEHIKECIAFAEENNLIPADELEDAKKVIQAIDRGLVPPRCKAKKECDVYCSRPENMEECIIFAKEAGFMAPGELQEAEKMLAAIKRGAKPPACAGREECDIYCSLQEHMAECMEFGIAAGFIPPEEIENVKKTLNAIKQGIMPPNCKGEEECNVYCSQVEHMAECMEFGIAAGFMAPQELENAKRTLEAIRKGVVPPNCQGEEECNIYCSQLEHFEECLNFSEAAGFISHEDAERARAGGGQGGPGGCKTEEECEAFCSKPENAQTCIDFSVRMGDISPEEAERMRQQTQGQMPPGSEGVPQTGPGGCSTFEECQAFCQNPENAQECMQFTAPEGMAPPTILSPEGSSIVPEGQQMPGVSPGEIQSPEGFASPTMQFMPPPDGAPVPLEGQQMPGLFPEGSPPPDVLMDQGQQIEQAPLAEPSQQPIFESPEPILWLAEKLLSAIVFIFLR